MKNQKNEKFKKENGSTKKFSKSDLNKILGGSSSVSSLNDETRDACVVSDNLS